MAEFGLTKQYLGREAMSSDFSCQQIIIPTSCAAASDAVPICFYANFTSFESTNCADIPVEFLLKSMRR